MLSGERLDLKLLAGHTDTLWESSNDRDAFVVHLKPGDLGADFEGDETVSFPALPLEEDALPPSAPLFLADAAEAQPQATEVAASGDTDIDSLLAGVKWGGAVHTGVTLTFSFENSSSTYLPGQHEPTNGFHELTDVQKAAARAALDYWSAVADVHFIEVADNAAGHGDIRFGRSDDPGTAYAYYPSSSEIGGDIWLGNTSHGDTQTYPLGSYYFRTFTHEIGHALGLKHPHNGGGSGVTQDPGSDWFGTSLMSYRTYPNQPVDQGDSASFGPSAPMLNDIAAIQYLYGANTSFHAGNDDYAWAPGARLFETIYDSGGVDTINWSNQSSAALIDLRSGAWSNLGPAYTWFGGGGGSLPTTLAIAYGVTIENAKGGSGNDLITGNATANSLYGNLGNDTLDGADGNDRLEGGNGTDRLAGGNGIDLLYGGNGNDTNGGANGNDVLDGGAGADVLWGGNGNDTFEAGNGTDKLFGDAGNDTLYGRDDNDSLIGGDGNDFVDGGKGQDLLYGGNGNDLIRSGPGADSLWGGAGRDNFVFDDNESGLGAAQRDRIYDFASGQQDRIDLSLIDANTATAADNAFVWKGAAALTGAGQVGYYLSGGTYILRGSVDADAATEFEIQLGGTAPAAGWLIL